MQWDFLKKDICFSRNLLISSLILTFSLLSFCSWIIPSSLEVLKPFEDIPELQILPSGSREVQISKTKNVAALRRHKTWKEEKKIVMHNKVKLLSHVWLFATPWAVGHQAPASMRFSRQEYWSGLPFPSPADLPDPGIEPRSPALQADALTSEPPGKPWFYPIKRTKYNVFRIFSMKFNQQTLLSYFCQ